MSAKKSSIFSRHTNLLGLSWGNMAPTAKAPTDTELKRRLGGWWTTQVWVRHFLLAIYSLGVALAVWKVDRASWGQAWLSCVWRYRCCFSCIKDVWAGDRFLHVPHILLSTLCTSPPCFTWISEIPRLMLLHHPLPRLLPADEGGGRRWWGWVWVEEGIGRRGKPQSQKWRTGRLCTYLLPQATKTLTKHFLVLQMKMWVGFQPGQLLPAKKMGFWSPWESRKQPLLFMASLSAPTTLSCFPGQATNGLSV